MAETESEMANFQRTNKFLATFLPALVEKQMGLQYERERAKEWLQKTLQEYAAYAQHQQDIQKSGLVGDLIRNLTNPEFFKERTLPEQQLREWIGKVAPDLAGQIPAAPAGETEAALGQAEGAMRNILLSTMADEYPKEQDLDAALRAFGRKAVVEQIAQVSKQLSDRLDRDLRAKEADIRAGEIPIRREELEVRRGELEFEKTGKKKKSEKEKDLERLEDDISRLAIQLFKPGQWSIDKESPAEKTEKNAIRILLIEKVSKIKKLKGELGVEPDPSDVKMADYLKKKGVDKSYFFKTPELLKRLTDNGYNPWRILELF